MTSDDEVPPVAYETYGQGIDDSQTSYGHAFPNDDTPVPESTAEQIFKPHPLGTTMRMGIVKPVLYGNQLLYPGKLQTISGPPESGKTVLCMHWAIEVMRLGYPVLVVDEEAGPGATASILLSLGAEPELVDKYLVYLPYPSVSRWDGEALDALDALMRDVKPKLSIWDSSAALMGVAGISENDNGEVTRFWSTVMSPVARLHRCTVLVTDHVGKDDTSRYSRGAGAKLAGVDVALKVRPVQHFSRHQDGLLELKVTKDRPGWLLRNWRVRVRHDPLRMEFAEADEVQAANNNGMSPAGQKLASVLSDVPSTTVDLVNRLVDAYGHGLYQKTVRTEMAALVAAGMADQMEQGKGRPILYTRPSAGTKPEQGQLQGQGQLPWQPSGPDWQPPDK